MGIGESLAGFNRKAAPALVSSSPFWGPFFWIPLIIGGAGILAESGLQFSKGEDTKGGLALGGGLLSAVGGGFGAFGAATGSATGAAGGAGASGGGTLGPAGFGGVGGGSALPGVTTSGSSILGPLGSLGPAGFGGVPGSPIPGLDFLGGPGASGGGTLGPAGFGGVGGGNGGSGFDLSKALQGGGQGLRTIGTTGQAFTGGQNQSQGLLNDKEAMDRARREREAQLRIADELYRAFLTKRAKQEADVQGRRTQLASSGRSLSDLLKQAAAV